MNTPTEPGPISPELVLVDPSLAELVRSADPAPEAAMRAVRPADPPPVSAPAASPVEDEGGSDDRDRWADELRLFLAPPVQDPPYAWPEEDAPAQETAAAAPAAAPAADDTEEVPAGEPERRTRRRAITPLRAAGVVIAVLALAGAGTTLGALISQSPGGTTSAEVDPTLPPPVGSASAPEATTTADPPQSTAAPTPQPRVVAWAPAPGAAAYDVALYEGSRRIFFQRTRDTRLALPARWRYEGRSERLDPGVYRWYVWPVAQGSAKASRRPVVQAKLTIPGD